MNSYRQILRTAPVARSRASVSLRNGQISSLASQAHLRALSTRSSPLSSSPEIRASPDAIPLLRSTLSPSAIRLESRPRIDARQFHASSQIRQKQAEEKETKEAKESTEEKPEAEAKTEEQKEEGKEGEEESEGKKNEKKKEDLPPPPPHGDKTPWQVFLETMQTEFKESKEWNESTKQLASSAHDFVESERVRKAREAYEATTGVVSNTAATVVKTTAGAVAKGASWTWETPVMKGVRKGANITGEALDKATKPIRETEAYKNVKEVIDDGSSMRYGGWIEKEERRKRRELREKLQKQNGEHPDQVLQENPE